MPVSRSMPASRTMYSVPRARRSTRYEVTDMTSASSSSEAMRPTIDALMSPSHRLMRGVSCVSTQPLKPSCEVVSLKPFQPHTE